MNDDAPRQCAVRGETTLGAVCRFRALGPLTLALLAGPLGSATEDTVPGTAHSGPATAAVGSLDPRGPARLSEAEPSPNGRFVALVAEGARRESALWFVDLEDGSFRPFEGGAPTGAPLDWRGGALWTEVRDERGSLGRRRLVAIDPASGRFDELPRGTELAPAWAHTVITRRAGGRRVLTLEWVGTERAFELPTGPDGDWRVTETAGIVFWSEREHDGALRVMRHDLATDRTVLVVIIGGDEPHWSPSPDGLLLATSDDQRLRILDGLDGEPRFGPWPAGVASWIPGGQLDLLVTSGGHHYVLDVYAGRRIHLGADEGPRPRVNRLAGGGYLVQRGERLERLDAGGHLVASLVD